MPVKSFLQGIIHAMQLTESEINFTGHTI